PFAAKRLHADDGTDHVAVHIDIADVRGGKDLGDRLVDARLHAEGETVAGGIDLPDRRGEIAPAEADDVQHRPEDLAVELADAVELDHGRQHEGTALERLAIGTSLAKD